MRRQAVGVGLACLALVAGCTGTDTAVRREPAATVPARPTAGPAQVARARALVTALVDRVVAAADALDQVDARCATGDRYAARQLRRQHATDVARGTAAVTALPAAVRAYRSALAGLRPTTPELQQAVASGLAEAAALDRVATTAGGVWKRYAQLDHDEAVWVQRAFVPWYRSRQESANAYAVLTDRLRAPLAAARRDLAAASTALAPLSRAAVTAFAAATP